MGDSYDNQYTTSTYFDDINPEEFFQDGKSPDGEAGMRYRSIAVAPPQEHVFHAFNESALKDPSYKVDASPVVPQQSIQLKSASSSGNSAAAVPEPLYGLPRTKFDMKEINYDQLFQRIDDYLKSLQDIDFSFLADHHTWKGKYLNGACCIELEVRLFQERGSNDYTVAVLKSKADARCGRYQEFFNAFRTKVTGRVSESKPRRGINMCELPGKDFPLPTLEQFLRGIEPIYKMAQEACMEPRLEAAKMLCDLSEKSLVFLQQDEFRTDCLAMLETLVQDNFNDVKQHSIMAISKFAEIESYQEGIISSRILPVLFALVDNTVQNVPSWDTAQIRRSAAATIALLCRKHAGAVRANLQHMFPLEKWVEKMVPVIRDERTRMSALTIAEFLQCDEAVAYACAAESSPVSDNILGSELHSIVR